MNACRQVIKQTKPVVKNQNKKQQLLLHKPLVKNNNEVKINSLPQKDTVRKEISEVKPPVKKDAPILDLN